MQIHGHAASDEVLCMLGAEEKRVFVPEARRALEEHQRAGARSSPHPVIVGVRVDLESDVERGVALAKVSWRDLLVDVCLRIDQKARARGCANGASSHQDVGERDRDVKRAGEEGGEPTRVVMLQSAAYFPEPAPRLGPWWEASRELRVAGTEVRGTEVRMQMEGLEGESSMRRRAHLILLALAAVALAALVLAALVLIRRGRGSVRREQSTGRRSHRGSVPRAAQRQREGRGRDRGPF